MKTFKIISKLMVAAITIGGIIVGGYYFLHSSLFRIYNIDIQVEKNIAGYIPFDKLKESGEQKFKTLYGQYVWNVDLEKVLSVIEKDLRVKEAKVTRVLPNTIAIHIQPHMPVANILSPNSQKLYPVARDGEIMPPLSAGEALDSPILHGEIFLENLELRKKAIGLLMLLPEEGLLSLKTASEMTYDKKRGFELSLSPTGLKVYLGFDEFAQRISQAKRVVDYLDSEKLSGRIIDARFGKKVVVKLRNEP